MNPAFLLMCYLSGAPAGTLHFENVNTCKYFKKNLNEQYIVIGEDEKRYSCFCKLVKVDKNRVRLW